MTDYKRFQGEGYSGVVRSDCDALVSTWLRDAQVLKQGPTRDVLVIEGPPKLYVKRFFGFPAGHMRAQGEFEALRFAQERRLPVPHPVALLDGSSDSMLVTEDLGKLVVLKSLLAGRGLDWGEKCRLFEGLAGLFRKLHEAGIDHQGLSAGLIAQRDGEYFLMDLHRVQILTRPLTSRETLPSLANFLVSIAPFVTRNDLFRLAKACGVPKSEWPDLVALAQRQNRRAALARGRACLAEEKSTGRDCVYLRPGVTLERIEELLGQIEKGTVIKEQKRKRLVKLPQGVLAQVIEYPGVSGAMRRYLTGDQAMRAWYNSALLQSRGIPTPPFLGLVVGPSRSVLLREWMDDALTLTQYAAACRDRKRAAERLAQFVLRMHENGFLHKDLKPNNILVREHADGTPEFFIIDLDRVDLGDRVPDGGRCLNLAQLNAGLGAPVTLGDRMRFYLTYAGWSKTWHQGRAELIRRIMKITRDRKHLWPK